MHATRVLDTDIEVRHATNEVSVTKQWQCQWQYGTDGGYLLMSGSRSHPCLARLGPLAALSLSWLA
jgi:hypothetical protein